MGLTSSKLKRELCILIVGLDAAGKTTLRNRLFLDVDRRTKAYQKRAENERKTDETTLMKPAPTVGASRDARKRGKVNLTIWDVGGQKALRSFWRKYYPIVQGVVFVIDSSDETRFNQARDELLKVAFDDAVSGLPLLVLLNKSDMAIAEPDELIEMLGISEPLAAKTAYSIAPVCALTGEGLNDAVDWLMAAGIEAAVTGSRKGKSRR